MSFVTRQLMSQKMWSLTFINTSSSPMVWLGPIWSYDQDKLPRTIQWLFFYLKNFRILLLVLVVSSRPNYNSVGYFEHILKLYALLKLFCISSAWDPFASFHHKCWPSPNLAFSVILASDLWHPYWLLLLLLFPLFKRKRILSTRYYKKKKAIFRNYKTR